MIFYFTGTGNSLAAAKKLLSEGEELINMAEALSSKRFEYCVGDGEKVGFVFPVYFFSLPAVVISFIKRLKLKNAGYVYSVITCGGGIGQAGAVLKKVLEKKEIELCYVTELVMPDNYILLYNNTGEGVSERLEKADNKLEEIKENIQKSEKSKIGNLTILSDITATMYQVARKTDKFYAEDSCIGCGLCEQSCPENVIKLNNGTPEWTKKKCSQCLACINRCPVRAIQYGKKTLKQGRYVHPDYK